MVIMSLLYPDEVSSTEIARIAGARHDSAWRVEFEAGGVRFRIARSFAPSSMVLDIHNEETGEFDRDSTGASDVRRRLGELVKLPAPSVMESLNFWVNTNQVTNAGKEADESGLVLSDDETDAGVELIGTDYFGNVEAAEETRKPVHMSDEERRVVSDEFRKTRTIEFVEDQLKHANAKLEALIDQLGRIVDETGETARLNRELANLPEMRVLSDAERELLRDPEGKIGDLEQKLFKIDEALDAERKKTSKGPSALYTNPVFLAGVGGTALLTVLSLIGEPIARRFALGNVATLGVALAGVFNWIGGMASTDKMGRRMQSLARRRDQVVAQDKGTRGKVASLREEFPVANLREYDESAKRRGDVEHRLLEIQAQHDAAYQTDEYKDLDRRKDRAETRLNALKLARRRLGDASVNSYELESSLKRAGLDPWVILWRPDPAMAELKRQVKKLGQVASKYRLISEDGLNPKTVSSWLRVAERILGDEVQPLNMTPDHQMVTEDGVNALEVFDVDTATAVVQALRMSLHLTLVKANAPGIHAFAIDVHSDRLSNDKIRRRLSKMYTGLGERLQMVVVTEA